MNTIKNSGDKELTVRLNTLENSDQVHTIEEVSDKSYGNGNTAENRVSEFLGKPTGSTTEYNPNGIRDINGKERQPVDALTHELLGHGYDCDQGTSTLARTSNGIRMNEVNAVKIENRMRAVNNEKSRTHYGGKLIPPSLLKQIYIK